MKIFTPFIISFLCIINYSSMAQNHYYEMFNNNEYDKIEKKLLAELNTEPNNVIYNHVLGKVYSVPTYANYNLHKSYEYLYSAYKFFKLAPSYDVERWSKIPLTETIIYNDFTKVCELLLENAIKTGTIPALNAFINSYTKAPQAIINKAVEARDNIAYESAVQENTIDSYNGFIKAYPFAKKVPEAVLKRDKLAFSEAKTIGTIEAYKAFIENYPTSELKKDAELAYSKILFNEQTIEGNYNSYLNFIKNNPKLPICALAIEKMVEIAKAKNDIKLLHKTVYYSKGIHYEYALYNYYLEFTSDGEYVTLLQFIDEFPNTSFEHLFPQDFKVAELGENLELYRGYDSTKVMQYINYMKAAGYKDKAFIALQRYISPEINAKQWGKALEKIKQVEAFFDPKNPYIKDLKDILTVPYDNNISVTPLPTTINTEGGVYSPVVSADDSQLFFCGKMRHGNIGGEDIFVSKKVNNEWANPVLIKELSDPSTNDAALSISTDGTTLIYFKGGTILVSEKTAQGWSAGTSISDEINNTQWSADAMISSDGNALIFTSVRKENLNYYTDPSYTVGQYHGTHLHQSDIYVSLRTPTGWGTPINVGPVINTIYTDRSPYLHPDMKTLYFSSDGHGGLGNLDVFMTTRLADSCWDCWSTPVNLGKEINTAEDNWGYKISTDGNYAYFATNPPRKNHHDLYICKLPEAVQPDEVITITGNILNSEQKAASVIIYWEDLETGKIIGQSKSDPSTGTYFIVLPKGKMYGYYIESDVYYPSSKNIDLTKPIKNKEITNNITVVTYNEMREKGESVTLNNVFFETAKSDLLPISIPELKRAAKIIKKYNLPVEISGHTDNVGDDAANIQLSERRAIAVKEYLIAQGCNPSLFTIKGYGETKPIATNDTPEGRAYNRRVEMRFVK